MPKIKFILVNHNPFRMGVEVDMAFSG